MHARVATALLFAMSAGCAVDQGDPASPGPGGKGDNTECSKDAYRTWLVNGYFPKLRAIGLPLTEAGLTQARTVAETQPCHEANDDAYLIWLSVWRDEWTKQTTPYNDAVTAIATAHGADAAYTKLLASGPTAEQVRTLTALELARPPGGPRGEAAWMELYKPFTNRIRVPLAAQTDIYEPAFTVDPAEAAFHHAIANASPDATLQGSLVAWLPVLDETLTASTVPGTTEISAAEQTVLDLVVGTAPSTKSDPDYVAWFTLWQKVSSKDGYAISPAKAQALVVVEAVMPNGGGVQSYAAWLTELVNRFSDYGNAPSAAKEEALTRYVAVKPCGTAPNLVSAYGRVQAAYPGAALKSLVDASGPSVCE